MIILAATLLLAQVAAPQDVPFEVSGAGYRLKVTPVSTPRVMTLSGKVGMMDNYRNQTAQTANRTYKVEGWHNGRRIDELATSRTSSGPLGPSSLSTVTRIQTRSGLNINVTHAVPGRTIGQQILNTPVYTPDLSAIQDWAFQRMKERSAEKKAQDQATTYNYRFKSEAEMKSFMAQNASKIRAAEKRGSPDPVGEVLQDLRAKGYYPIK
jgi:hypothetical protein